MNKLYFGDNLDVLRERIKDVSVDLVYLDPPFNSSATYNVLFKESAGVPSEAKPKLFGIHGGGANWRQLLTTKLIAPRAMLQLCR